MLCPVYEIDPFDKRVDPYVYFLNGSVNYILIISMIYKHLLCCMSQPIYDKNYGSTHI